jgi:hypothetical protein
MANAPSPQRGAGGTLKYLFRDYTGLRRDVRPAGAVFPVSVSPVRPSPPLQRHAGHCDDISDAVGVHGDGASPRPPLCRVRTLEPAHGRWPGNQPLHRHPRSCSCTRTGRATTPRLEQDLPGRPSAPSLPYKRSDSPSAARRIGDSDHPRALRLHHDIGTCLNQYLWDLEARRPLPPRL